MVVRLASRGALGAAALAFAVFRPALASANGRFPASNQVLSAPFAPNLVIARTTYGILESHDNGGTWAYLCEDALGLPADAIEDPELGLTAGGALIAGLRSPAVGLDVSPTLGCDWNCVGGALNGQAIADVVVRPDNGHVVLALSSTFLPTDAGGGTSSQVFESTDDGATWAAIGTAIDVAVTVQTIDVAATDPHRIYVSGTRGYGAARTASLFVSTDDGTSWSEQPVTDFDATIEASVYIAAVDPSDPDRVYLRTSALDTGGQSRLYVTTDAGQSFAIVRSFQVPDQGVLAITGELLGFALSPDGSKVYAGTKEDGLFVANRADLIFAQTSAVHVQCLATIGPELWACSDEVSGFVIGASADDGAHFVTKLPSITSLSGTIACDGSTRGALACGSSTNGSQCTMSFQQFCQRYPETGQCGPIAADAGTDAGIDAGDAGAAGRPSPSSCGCTVASIGTSVRSLGLFGVIALAAWRRRQTRRARARDVTNPVISTLL